MKSTTIKRAASETSLKNKSRKKTQFIKSNKHVRKSTPNANRQELVKLAALFAEERYAEAAAISQAMTVRSPEYGFGWKALGVALKQLGQNADALAPMQKAATLMPNDAEAHNNLGALLHDLGLPDEAIACYRCALRIKPDYPQAYCNLGITLQEPGQLNEAEASFRQALKIDPRYYKALHGLGNLYLENGQTEAARSLFEQALQISPDSLEVRYSMTLTQQVAREDTNFAKLVEIANAEQNRTVPLSKQNKMFLHFALGKCYEQSGDYEHAFPHFLAGCKLKRTTLNYDPEQAIRQFSGIMDIFDQNTIKRLRGAGNPSNLPIFILGMPRSGTTLVEQIIASHPKVYGGGELPDLMRIARQSVTPAPVGFPDNLRTLDQETLSAWGMQYVDRLKRRAINARHITDKMPENSLAVGLIHLMLPNAKIIHVNRNPVDTCLSCFTQPFTGTLGYTYDLTELGQYYVNYSRLMEHWRKVLPVGAFLDVHYEDIVADQAGQTRRMLEHCGLEWNDACLDFHKYERWVRTASTVQVRQPIYQSSVDRWHHYEKFLTPLLNALGELAPKG